MILGIWLTRRLIGPWPRPTWILWNYQNPMSHINSEFLTCILCSHTWCYRCAYHKYFLQPEKPPCRAIQSCRYCSLPFTDEQTDFSKSTQLGNQAYILGLTASGWPVNTAYRCRNSSALTVGYHFAIPVSWKLTSLTTPETRTYQHLVPSVHRPSPKGTFGNYDYRNWSIGTLRTQQEETPQIEHTVNVRRILPLQETQHKTDSLR